jgi:hypothetical protein
LFIFIARCSDAFLAANKAENTSGIFGFAHVVPVSITDLNNFEIVKKRAVACLLFQPCGFIFSLEGFPYNANILELINQLLGCSRVVNGDVARIVPMFQKERENEASGFWFCCLHCHTPSPLGGASCFGPGEESCSCFKVTSDGRID